MRSLVPDGLQWPLGLAMGTDGQLLVADGGYTYTLKPGGRLQTAGMLFTPGFPGYTRGVAACGPGEYVVTTASGQVTRWRPEVQESNVLADGFDQLMGVAVAPGGAVIFAEMGTGRVLSVTSGNVEVLAKGLDKPSGVAFTADGHCLISEAGAGKIVKLSGDRAETVLDGLQCPQGILVQEKLLYVVNTAAKELVEYHLGTGTRRSVATGLPVGAPAGVTPKFLRGIQPFTGPMVSFAGITAGTDGTLYLSADAEGSVLALHPG